MVLISEMAEEGIRSFPLLDISLVLLFPLGEGASCHPYVLRRAVLAGDGVNAGGGVVLAGASVN